MPVKGSMVYMEPNGSRKRPFEWRMVRTLPTTSVLWTESFEWEAIKQSAHYSYMYMRIRRNEATREAKHKARMNETEGEEINVQGYGMALT
jgi:hypothetical protein